MAVVAHPNGMNTTDSDDDDDGDSNRQQSSPRPSIATIDSPAESFRMKMEEMGDWIDVYGRDDSTRGNTNPKSNGQSYLRQLSGSSMPRFGSGSQRFSGPIIGLPRALRPQSGYLGRSARRHPRLFPRKKQKGMALREPTSPRVSCLGRVRSERDRTGRSNKDGGCPLWRWFAAFSSSCGKNQDTKEKRKTKIVRSGVEDEVVEEAPEEDEKNSTGMTEATVVPLPGGPPGLGGLKRFSSGRRTASWADDVERSEPL